MIYHHKKEGKISINEKIKIENVHIHLYLLIHSLIKEKEGHRHLLQLIRLFNQIKKL